MSYNSIISMASNATLLQRIAAAAASLSSPTAKKPMSVPGGDPHAWAQSNVWQVVASAGWSDAWDKALGQADRNYNPDTGARTDVITDKMIEDAVRTMLERAQPAEEPATDGPEVTAT